MPFSQGHLASVQTGLDFVNTLDLWPTTHDHLDSPKTALEWLCGHGLMHGEARENLLRQYEGSPGAGWEMLARLHRVREAMRGVLEARAGARAPDVADLAEINRALRTHYIYELVPATDGLYDEFGAKRVVGTPISETAIAGAALGAALVGLRATIYVPAAMRPAKFGEQMG